MEGREPSSQEKIVIILGLLGLVLLVLGLSYAVFMYSRQGTTLNTIQTGNLTFVYDEQNKEGNGIKLEDAFPVSDDVGKGQSKEGHFFEFQIAATTKGSPIYYEIYAEKDSSSTLPNDKVRTYLTKVSGSVEEEVIDPIRHLGVVSFDQRGLSQVPGQTEGRTLYQEMIPAGEDNYVRVYRFRMWLAEDATDTDGNGSWSYNDQKFTIRINLYASDAPLTLPVSS